MYTFLLINPILCYSKKELVIISKNQRIKTQVIQSLNLIIEIAIRCSADRQPEIEGVIIRKVLFLRFLLSGIHFSLSRA